MRSGRTCRASVASELTWWLPVARSSRPSWKSGRPRLSAWPTEAFAKAFKFAFVRDPLERAYSAYAFLRGNALSERDHAAQQLVRHYRDFDDFVARWLHPETISRQLHFAAQTDFLTDSLGRLGLDFVGYQEHLQRDFSLVCEHLGQTVSLPHVNRSQQRRAVPAREFCTIRTRRLVRRIYQRDYDLLGYE